MTDTFIYDLYYPCALYALRRTGRNDITVGQLLYQSSIPYEKSKLEPGDIVYWYVNPIHVTANSVIENLTPIEYTHTIVKHFAVYEGDNLISETQYNDKHYPYIRIKHLDSMEPPHYIVKFKGESYEKEEKGN